MVAPPFKRRFSKKNIPFSRLISAILVVLLVWAFSAGVEKLTGYDILGLLYTSDKPEPSRVDKTFPKVSKERMGALLREHNFYGILVSHVIDGDTLEVSDRDGARFKVRLYGSDAPETEKPEQEGQPFGEEAFTALRNKVEGKRVDIEVVDIDRYGRAVAIVRQDGRNINIEMVSDGLAECYTEYLEGPQKKECVLAEVLAKRLKKGMWALKNYERPNDFRKRMRQGS
mgnify:FL=1